MNLFYLVYAMVLFLNVVGTLVYFVTGGSGVAFGVSLIQVLVFTPCSFVLWFRSIYKGFRYAGRFIPDSCVSVFASRCSFRSDSSMNFMVYFFVSFILLVFVGVQA